MTHASPLALTERADPHRARRLAILREHPEVRELFGYDSRIALLGLLAVAAQLGLACAMPGLARALWGPIFTVAAMALLFGSVLSHFCGCVIHECAHNTAARTPLQNRALAIVATFGIGVPIAESFRRYHLPHHLYLGQIGRDATLPSREEQRWVNGQPFRKILWLTGHFAMMLWRGATSGSRLQVPMDGAMKLGSLVNVVGVAVVLAVLCKWGGPESVAYLFLSSAIGAGPHPVATHYYQDHLVTRDGQETYSYYGAWNWLTLNIGYHNEHHDFMNVPGSRLPRLKRAAPGFYEPLRQDRSAAAILLRFIRDRRLSPSSRVGRIQRVMELWRES